MMNRSQIEKMLMASGGITGEPVQTARIGSYMRSTGGGKRSNTVTQRTTSGGGSTTQRKTQTNIDRGNASRQLDNLVNKSRGDSNYRNRPNVYTVNEILDKSNPLNLSKREKDFILRAGLRKDGTLNSAGQARIAQRVDGVSRDGSFIQDNRTAYQRDLNNFRKASPINNQAYIDRFPKTAAFESMLNKAAEGIVGMPGRIIKKVTDNYLDGVQNMIEKISGVDAKNVEIAKDKNTDIDTIVKNLQRNVEKKVDEEKDREIRTGLPGDLTEEIPVDDIVNAELIEVEEDSPLKITPTEGIAQSEAEQKELEGGTQTRGLTPIRLDRFAGTGEDEGLFDLLGSDEPGKVSAFELDPDKSYYDFESGTVIDPYDAQAEKEYNVMKTMLQPSTDITDMSLDEFRAMNRDMDAARGVGFPDIDVTQEGTRDFRIDTIPPYQGVEGQAIIDNQGLVYTDGSPVQDRTLFGTALTGERNPTPLFDSEIDEEAIRRAIEGKANGGQIFGNQNMSTFDKLKAIADGIADNK